MIVSTTWIARSIRSAGSIGTTACTRARPGWCSTSSAAVLTVLSLVFGNRTPIRALGLGRALERCACSVLGRGYANSPLEAADAGVTLASYTLARPRYRYRDITLSHWKHWSGRRDSNPRPRPRQGSA